MSGRRLLYTEPEGSSVLYRTSGTNTEMNAADVVYLYGTSDNVMLAEEKNSAGQPVAYGYTKDIRGSTGDLIDSVGQTLVRYAYNNFHTYYLGKDSILVHNANCGKTGAGKSDPHRDAGRALTKAEKQVIKLEQQLKNATGNEVKKIKQKINNMNNTARGKGETHWRR